MKSTITQSSAVIIAFATGFVAGILLAPRSGNHTRQRLTDQARDQLHSAEKQLEVVEHQIADLNDRIHETGRTLSGKIRKAASEIVDQHIPDLAEDTEQWSKGGEEEVMKDLRNITRK